MSVTASRVVTWRLIRRLPSRISTVVLPVNIYKQLVSYQLILANSIGPMLANSKQEREKRIDYSDALTAKASFRKPSQR